MRILLFTGKGGVGKSTLAAATACASAAAGHRTLVLSTDAAHSLADALDVTATGEPTEVAPDLWVQHVDAQERFERSWGDIQGYLLSVLDVAGVDPVAAEELTVIPGAEEVLALLEVRAQARSGEWDVLVVDCAPTAETLRLLALPEALGWYMTRVLPVERRVVKALKPVLTPCRGRADAGGLGLRRDRAAARRARRRTRRADRARDLGAPRADARVGGARRGAAGLHVPHALRLHRGRGDREPRLPRRAAPTSGVRRGWRRSGGCWPTRRTRSPGSTCARRVYRPRNPWVARSCSTSPATVYGDADPLARGADRSRRWSVRSPGGGQVLSMPLPLADQDDVRLARKGDELVVGVASYRRLLTLPSGLARHRVAGARVHEGELQVRLPDRDRPRDRHSRRGDHVSDAGDAPRRRARSPRRPRSSSARCRAGRASTPARRATDCPAWRPRPRRRLTTSNEHLATGAAECTVCPVCRTVHAVRQLSPEVTAHLAAAVTSLAQAAAALMASTAPRPRVRHGRDRDVEHIDLDDDWPDRTTVGVDSVPAVSHSVRRVRRRPPSHSAPSAHSDSCVDAAGPDADVLEARCSCWCCCRPARRRHRYGVAGALAGRGVRTSRVLLKWKPHTTAPTSL